MKYQDLINGIQSQFPGYHFTITLYPSGGMLDLEQCDECGTTGDYSQSWKYWNGGSIDTAIEKLRAAVTVSASSAPAVHYPVEFGPSDARRLECACGNPDPGHADSASACQHDLLLPNPTVYALNPYAGQCKACGRTWQLATAPTVTGAP
jgi:hypothetical protein